MPSGRAEIKRRSKPVRGAIRWIAGGAVGTLVFLAASPWFVRSYLPNQTNRTVATLPAGYVYRWRSEGYADTRIGPFGMPGKTAVASPDEDVTRVAIWGDSQAEGVAVDDDDKFFAALDRAFDGRIESFPLALSGDALGHWIAQVQWSETHLGIDRHLILVCQVDDLLDITPPRQPTSDQPASNQPTPNQPASGSAAGRFGGLTSRIPAAVVEAVRNVAFDSDGSLRRLRFSIGPTKIDQKIEPQSEPRAIDAATSKPTPTSPTFAQTLGRLRAITDRPIDILYAPLAPQIVGGKIIRLPPDAKAADQASLAAKQHGIGWIDATAALRAQFDRGIAPHGFDNGRPGTGHLNKHGYRVLADVVADAFDQEESAIRLVR